MFSELEFRRKILHIFFGLIAVALIYYDLIQIWAFLILIVAGIIISFISARLEIPVISQMLKWFDRNEKTPGNGAITLVIGIALVWTIFYGKKDIICASVMILSLGDSFSLIVGKYFGKRKHPLNSFKMIEGTIAGIIAGFFGALIFVSFLEALFASVVAMLIEAVNIKIGKQVIDDNLIIPIVAGVVIYIIRLI